MNGTTTTTSTTTPLPPKDSPLIHLAPLTPAEHLAQTEANSTEWRGALDTAAYHRREAHLLNQDLTRGGGLTAWGLVYQPNGAGTRVVLAGCETYRKRGIARRPGGGVEEGIVHGVGSVFCPPMYRGMGYAGRMMADLGEKLRGWQVEGEANEALASVLYSDIGKIFYAAKGWAAYPSAHIALSATTSDAPAADLPETRLLAASDLPSLCARDEALLRRRLAKPTADDATPAVALIPDLATIRWHHAREEFVGHELFGKTPTVKGAVTGSPGKRVWCYWTRIFTNPAKETPVLHVLRLVVEDEGFEDFGPAPTGAIGKAVGQTATARGIAAVLAAARRQAGEWGLRAVVVWNPSATTVAAARGLEEGGVEVVEREVESIASLRWYGLQGERVEVEWVANEKFGWC